jgi:hypothetical protein
MHLIKTESAEEPYITIGAIATALYFGWFLVIVGRSPSFFSSFSTLDAVRTAYTQWSLRFAHSSQTGLVPEHFCGERSKARIHSRASLLGTSGRRLRGEEAGRGLEGVSKRPLKMIMVNAAHLLPCPSCRRAETAGGANPTWRAWSTTTLRRASR